MSLTRNLLRVVPQRGVDKDQAILERMYMFGGDGGVSPASSPRVGSTGSERATPEIAAITGGSNGSNGSPVSSQLPPAGPGSPGRWPQGAAPAPGSVGAVKQNTLAPAPVEEEDLEIEVRPPQSRCFLSLDSQAHRVVPRRRLTLKSPTGGTMTDPTDPTTTSAHPPHARLLVPWVLIVWPPLQVRHPEDRRREPERSQRDGVVRLDRWV